MRNVALSDAKDNLSTFVEAAASGDEIVITRHGKPKAKLVSAVEQDESRRGEIDAAFATLARIRSDLRTRGMTATIDELIAWKNEGRP
jgi:prevent-host-death family protein